MPRRACGAAAYTGGQNMRKWIALILVFALCLCAPAWAESVTDALGITGGEEGAVRGDLSARTDTDLYVVTNEGSDKVLVRIPRAGGANVRVESASSISDLVTAGDLLYFLRVNNGTATLMRRNTDSTRSEVYTFPLGSAVSTLTYHQGNLYALIDNQLNVIYPSTGQCVMLSGTTMLDYVIVGDTIYYISGSDLMTYETDSLLGDGTLSVESGCLYRMSLTSGESSLVVKTGIEDLRYNNGALYFHNLSDNYVMGDETREWMEGKLYRYDLEYGQLTRLVNGYDWGFYPMDGGVAVYTDGDLSYYNDLGGLERSMYSPEAYAVLSGGGDVVVIYEPTAGNITYAYADGTTASANDGEPGYSAPAAQDGGETQTGDGTQTGSDAETGNGTNEGDGTSSGNGSGSGSGNFTSGGSDWFEENQSSGGGSSSGSGSGGSGTDIPTFTEKDS